ncbi:CDC45-like protein [Hanseniaspora valbyensis NRRL Y-1626]|uniref:CDC45-like protein n=1 Tax=Hanseniaspora valbyensis NRRL Y-1626 TaxID=766949 RepID=A0A1B7TI63_9ASCO|nr:CDC45-like protein [Hanseniaspora valbyensis NRRL Y-1626]
MHVRSSELPSIYNKLLLLAHSQSCGVVIFVSCLDLDSINAAKMLSLILKKDLVQLQIIPVTGFSNLKEVFLRLDESSKIVIFIGCGGMLNLIDYLPEGNDDDDEEEEEEDVERDVSCVTSRTIYIFDSHRPWDLHNLFGNDNIYCIDDYEDAFTDLEDIKKIYYNFLEMEDDPELDSDNDDEDADLYDNMNEQDDFDDIDEEEEGEVNPLKRKITEKAIERRQIKKKRTEFSNLQRKLNDYYQQGTFIRSCLSRTIYFLVKKLGYANLQTTWLYITGVVSLERTVPQIAYSLKNELIKETKLMTNFTNSSNNNNNNKRTSQKNADLFQINFETDYHLFLLRQTSLLDSFLLSNYCNAKMQLWHESGRKKLNSMFARMGISLIESQKNWLYLSSTIKQKLAQIMEDNLSFYGLQNLIKKGFVKNNGFRNSCSANDFVEAIMALLEINIKTGISENSLQKTNNNNNNNTDKNEDELDDGYEELPVDEMLVERSKKWVENFWQCWDCLNEDGNQVLLKKGLVFSHLLQKQIVSRGTQYIESRSIRHMKHFRLCVLKEGNDLQLYKHPLTLLRLGDWLLECCCESSDDKTLLPMVIAAFDSKTNTYLCAGMSPKYPLGMIIVNSKRDPIPNKFGNAFRAVARDTNATVRIESFDSTIIEVKKEDFLPFLENLSLSGFRNEKDL